MHSNVILIKEEVLIFCNNLIRVPPDNNRAVTANQVALKTRRAIVLYNQARKSNYSDESSAARRDRWSFVTAARTAVYLGRA